MDHQIIRVPKKFIKHSAELRNPEGKIINNTSILQKNRKNDQLMENEVRVAYKAAAYVLASKKAQIYETFAMNDEVFAFNMN